MAKFPRFWVRAVKRLGQVVGYEVRGVPNQRIAFYSAKALGGWQVALIAANAHRDELLDVSDRQPGGKVELTC